MTMRKRNMKRNWGAQRGYAMIGVIAAVGIAATSVLVTSLSSTAIQNEQGRKTNSSLALAKQALIGRAAADDNRPGSLPCPDKWELDSLNAGTPTTPCDTVDSQIGRLPWKTLGLPDLRDADGERLWYAVSPGFRDATGNIINSNTQGQIFIIGTTSTLNVAAIVFAPGAQINAQRRDGGERQRTVANYLESIPYPGYTYASAPLGDNYNDKMMVIMPADIFAVVQKRVANEVQLALNEYFAINGKYPFAALGSNSSCMSSNMSAACGSVHNVTAGLIPATPEAVAGFPSYPTLSLLAHSSESTTDQYNWFDKNGWRGVVAFSVSAECTTNSPACATGSLSVTVGSTTLTNQKLAISFSGVLNGTPAEVLKTAYIKGVE